jgi:hypothetical protein
MDVTDITDVIAEAERATVQAATALVDVQVDLVIARQHLRAVKRQLAAGPDRRVDAAWVDDAETTRVDLAHAYLEMARLALHFKRSAARLTAVLEAWIALRRGAWTTDRSGSRSSNRNSSSGTSESTS